MATNNDAMDVGALSRSIRQSLLEAGFEMVGIAPAITGLNIDRVDRWLAEGKAGEMDFMARQRDARADPNQVLAGVQSVVVAALAYRTVEPAADDSQNGRISRYAWGGDYHEVVRNRLHLVGDRIRGVEPGIRLRAVVDSAPLMERDYAQLAGLGWIGKNTLLLNRRLGSWFFLGAILVDRELEFDQEHLTEHCGTCTRCLEACPTGAFDGPYQLDPRKCISYLTIEHRSPIPEPLRPQIGNWLFGCDVCQDVCPWNNKAPASTAAEFAPVRHANPVDLVALLGLNDADFRARFRHTPLFRTKRERVLRNACIVAGNLKLAAAVPILRQLADAESDATLAEAAVWAIQQIES